MKTIDLELAQELQSVCKEKNITMPKSEKYLEVMMGGLKHNAFSQGNHAVRTNLYTLDELLEWLPIMRTSENYTQGLAVQVEKDYNYNSFHNNIPPETMQWKARFESLFTVFKEPTWEDKTTTPKFLSFTDPNPANAACKLLIWLIKEGLI